jgi:hypothetical protein
MRPSYAETDTSFATSGVVPVAAAAKERGNLMGGAVASAPLGCVPLTPTGFDSYVKKKN